MAKKIEFRKKNKKIDLSDSGMPSDKFYENLESELKKYISLEPQKAYEALRESIYIMILLNAWAEEKDKSKSYGATIKIMQDVRKSDDVIKIEFLDFCVSIKAFTKKFNYLKYKKEDPEIKEIINEIPLLKLMFDGWVIKRLTEIEHFKR